MSRSCYYYYWQWFVFVMFTQKVVIGLQNVNCEFEVVLSRHVLHSALLSFFLCLPSPRCTHRHLCQWQTQMPPGAWRVHPWNVCAPNSSRSPPRAYKKAESSAACCPAACFARMSRRLLPPFVSWTYLLRAIILTHFGADEVSADHIEPLFPVRLFKFQLILKGKRCSLRVC